MEGETKAHIAALTSAVVHLTSVLVQREVIDRGDADRFFEIIAHTLRHPGNEVALQQIATWRDRVLSHGKDSIPLLEG